MEIKHYGTKYHSGRYPYGSGENPFQHDKKLFYKEYRELKDKGMSEGDISKYFDDKYYGGKGTFNTTQLRAYITIGKEQQDRDNVTRALYLRNEKQMGPTAIGKEMGVPESTVRSWLDPNRKEKLSQTRELADVLKNQIEDYAKDGKYLDVGKGTELQLKCSTTKLNTAIAVLEDEGYRLQSLQIKQVGTGKNTPVKVLTKDDVEWKEVINNLDKVAPVEGIQPSKDAKHFEPIPYPVSISSSRIQVRYAEQGGAEKDGVIEIRPGVKDLSLGENNYAQVRIAVDDNYYLKGMAIYNPNLPKGVDILLNSNKSEAKGIYGSLKEMEKKKVNGVETDQIDEDKPFGATVKRAGYYVDTDGKKKQSAINIVNEDVNWDKWSKNLASQFLSKQPLATAKKQLQLAYDRKEQEYEDIMAITNPVLKKKMLEEFAESCDSAAVNLKAAPFPRQATHVILPLTSLKDNEIYAPNYRDGEEVILVRYPHEGIFEIPRLKVNNHSKEGKEVIGNARNAVGINSTVAAQLSGADFDGDTVVVIPTRGQNLKTSKPLKELDGFDTKAAYPAYEGMPKTGPKNGFQKQVEMGKITNLITDMTIAGAPLSDIAKATKHAMVVIDAEKHNLDWRKSYEDNDIAYLKEKYRGKTSAGASTLISRAKSEEHVSMRKLVTSANDKDLTPKQRKDFLEGKKVYKTTPVEYLTTDVKFKDMTPKQLEYYKEAKAQFKKTGTLPENKEGLKFKVVEQKITSTKMAETDDAFTLSSGTPIETVYATHANKLKSLANTARKEALATQPMAYSPAANKTYKKEVDSLMNKLKVAELNSPLERQAQMIANKVIAAKKADDPDLKTDKDALKKVSNKALAEARARVGASKTQIDITPKEWEAIQAGAVSSTRQARIFANTNDKNLKKLATPQKETGLSPNQTARAKRLLEAGYTQADVADSLGISVSTLRKYVSGKK